MNQSTRFRPNLNQLEDRTTPALFVVNNFTDVAIAGKLNLREAITQTNALANVNGNDIIAFQQNPIAMSYDEPPPPPQPAPDVVLLSALPPITEGVDINGMVGMNRVTIRRDTGNSTPFRIQTINIDNYTVKLNDLRNVGGNAIGAGDAGNGGGIWSNNTVVDLRNVEVSLNSASGDGGGIWARGAVSGQTFTI